MCNDRDFYNDDEDVGCAMPILVAVLIILFLILFSSCRTITKVEYRDVNHYITNVVHDTLREQTKDSVFQELVIRNDTVYATKYKELIHYRDRLVYSHDTCWRDSIRVEIKENTKEIVKIPKIFKISLVFSILCCIFAIIKIIRNIQIH